MSYESRAFSRSERNLKKRTAFGGADNMKKSFFTRCLCFVGSFLLYFLPVSSKQQEVKRTENNIRYEVTVTLKLIQVYINDKEGRPVTNLTASDFSVWDNGQLRKITDFEVHTGQLPNPVQTEEEITASRTQAPPTLNRKFYLIFDFFRNDLLGIDRAKKAAVHFIDKKLLPTDEVAVLSFSPRKGLILHQYLSSDHQKAKDAVRMTRGMTYFRTLDAQFEDRLSLEDSSEDIAEAGAGAIMDLRGILKNYFESMKELAKSLRNIPGFKNIIFFSGGLSNALVYKKSVEIFPDAIVLANTDSASFYEGLMSNRNSSAVLDGYEDMIKEFASANCPVYSVNTEGVRA